MKSLSANILFLCCNFKLYKVGLLIGLIYLIPNLIIIACIFQSANDNFTLLFMCVLTVLTSVLLIKGLMEERPHLLMPWLLNIAVLIVFNIIFLMAQFDELNRVETKQIFYLEFGYFISLEIQIIFWYIIYCISMYGYRKNRILKEPIESISKIVEKQDNEHVLVIDNKNVICV